MNKRTAFSFDFFWGRGGGERGHGRWAQLLKKLNGEIRSQAEYKQKKMRFTFNHLHWIKKKILIKGSENELH